MLCIDTRWAAQRMGLTCWAGAVGVASTLWLTGCASTAPEPVAVRAPAPVAVPAAVVKAPAPPSAVARDWNEFKLQAAKRMVAANPNGTYMGKPQEVLLAIPVLEMELFADGSIKNIAVLRRPGQAPETLQLAVDAVKRSAPFGDVSKLPKPWKFVEVFLFNDDKRFKPRTLDQ